MSPNFASALSPSPSSSSSSPSSPSPTSDIDESLRRLPPTGCVIERLDGAIDVTSAWPPGVLKNCAEFEGSDLDLSFLHIVDIEPAALKGLALTSLDLSFNNLTQVAPTLLEDCSKLTYLSLQDNRLSSLPDGLFASCTAIEDLLLQHNELSTVAGSALAPLASLERLRLDHNELTSMDTTGCAATWKKIQHIDLSFNQLSAFPNLSGMSSLIEVVVTHNVIASLPPSSVQGLSSLLALFMNENMLPAIPTEALRELTQLEALSFANNVLKELNALDFAACNDLSQLDLSHNNIAKLTGPVFEGAAMLIYLNLAHNEITEVSFANFRGLRHLEQLLLHDNQLGVLQARSFQLPALRVLHLAKNQIRNISESAFEWLGPSVQELLLGENELYSIEPRCVARLSGLSVLDLSFNNLQTIAIGFFSGISRLLTLNLSHNPISSLPTNIFAPLVNLATLRMGSTNLKALPEHLFKATKNLATLDLSNSKLHSVAGADMEKLRKLEYIVLTDNQLSWLPSDLVHTLRRASFVDMENNPGENDERCNVEMVARDYEEALKEAAEAAPAKVETQTELEQEKAAANATYKHWLLQALAESASSYQELTKDHPAKSLPWNIPGHDDQSVIKRLAEAVTRMQHWSQNSAFPVIDPATIEFRQLRPDLKFCFLEIESHRDAVRQALAPERPFSVRAAESLARNDDAKEGLQAIVAIGGTVLVLVIGLWIARQVSVAMARSARDRKDR